MKLNDYKISQEKTDKNFKFYLFLKEFNGSCKITESQINTLLCLSCTYANCDYSIKVDIFKEEVEKIKNEERQTYFYNLFSYVKNEEDFSLLVFSLKLLQIKPLLLESAKLISSTSATGAPHPLSIEYDNYGRNRAYYSRVNGALFSLLFFNFLEKKNTNFMTEITKNYIESLIEDYHNAKKYDIEPNEIFMLMFSECVNQSIKSSAGSSYENIILTLLISIGIPETFIKKVHDKIDPSTEYDFFFKIEQRSYGISAKRTLRERYKQFIKTNNSSHIDVMIEITLGLDLSEEKAKNIRQHNTYIFVSDEVYNSRKYLQEIDGVFPGSEFTLKTLKALPSKKE